MPKISPSGEGQGGRRMGVVVSWAQPKANMPDNRVKEGGENRLPGQKRPISSLFKKQGPPKHYFPDSPRWFCKFSNQF
jgi:hypothetical protein